MLASQALASDTWSSGGTTGARVTENVRPPAVRIALSASTDTSTSAP